MSSKFKKEDKLSKKKVQMKKMKPKPASLMMNMAFQTGKKVYGALSDTMTTTQIKDDELFLICVESLKSMISKIPVNLTIYEDGSIDGEFISFLAELFNGDMDNNIVKQILEFSTSESIIQRRLEHCFMSSIASDPKKLKIFLGKQLNNHQIEYLIKSIHFLEEKLATLEVERESFKKEEADLLLYLFTQFTDPDGTRKDSFIYSEDKDHKYDFFKGWAHSIWPQAIDLDYPINLLSGNKHKSKKTRGRKGRGSKGKARKGKGSKGKGSKGKGSKGKGSKGKGSKDKGSKGKGKLNKTMNKYN